MALRTILTLCCALSACSLTNEPIGPTEPEPEPDAATDVRGGDDPRRGTGRLTLPGLSAGGTMGSAGRAMEADAGHDSGATAGASGRGPFQDWDAELDAGAALDGDAGPDAAAGAATTPDAQQLNGCGGELELEHEPGEPCERGVGVCPSGRNCAYQSEWACSGTELVYCACCELDQ